MTINHDTTPAMEPARGYDVFEKTVNTLDPKGERPVPNQPGLSEAIPPKAEAVLSIPPLVQKDTVDAMGDRIEAVTEKQVIPSNGTCKVSQAERMVNLAKANGSTTLYHMPDGDVFASIMINGHIENVKVRSHDFRQLLGMLHYRHTGKPAGYQAVLDAMEHLDTEGRCNGPVISMHLRYAWHDGSIYIDLCDPSWNQVKITSDGCKIISSKESPVKFYRAQGMASLPVPEQGGSIDLLRRFLNIENDSDWVMIVSWIMGSMNPTGPYPILVLQGEQGTAKSTTARIVRNLIDPSLVPSQSLSRSEHDLLIAASKSWVLNLDNLSYLNPLMSDALCQIATGGGFRTRKLYKNKEEQLIYLARPMIMNGIADIATRHDLADRCLIVQLPRIPKNKRLSEKELMMQWDLTKGKLFGALCNALSVALANVKSVKLPYLPRMADFAIWATAAEPAFGWESGTFMREYENNQRSLVENALEADPVAIAVINFIKLQQAHEWHGTATELLRVLSTFNQDLASSRSWPRKGNVLSGQLRRAAPSLREIGIDVEWTKSGDRLIHITTNEAFRFDKQVASNHDCDAYDVYDLDDLPEMIRRPQVLF